MEQETTENEQTRTLFLGGLNFSSTENDIMEIFGKFGKIVHCTVLRTSTNPQDPNQLPRSRGIGFVTYSTSRETDNALEMESIMMNDRRVDIKRAKSRENTDKNSMVNDHTKKIYIDDIGEMKEPDLKNYFEQYGNVEEVIIPKSSNVPSRPCGFAFVAFSCSDTVDKIVIIKMHTIKGREFEVKKATPQTDGNNQRGGGYGGGRGRGGYGGRGYGSDSSYGGSSYGGGGSDSYAGGGGNYSDDYGSQWSSYGPVRGGRGGGGIPYGGGYGVEDTSK